MTSDFEQFVASVPAHEGPFRPFAYYDCAGDCIEFFASNEMYYAERVDALVTVFIGERSGQIVGSLIKGVSHFLKSALEHSPGLRIDIEDGYLHLEHLFTAKMWRSIEPPEGTTIIKYKKLR